MWDWSEPLASFGSRGKRFLHEIKGQQYQIPLLLNGFPCVTLARAHVKFSWCSRLRLFGHQNPIQMRDGLDLCLAKRGAIKQYYLEIKLRLTPT